MGSRIAVPEIAINPARTEHWQDSMVHAIRDPVELLKKLKLEPNQNNIHYPDHFKLLVPLPFFKKIRPGDWNDPILKQILPIRKETEQADKYVADPVGDLHAIRSKGLIHKYQGRVLLIITGACAVHCRYCFRRHFPYVDSMPDKAQWANTIALINSDKSIHEVILSGGDPLMLPDERLKAICNDLAAIPHVTTLRVHTRLPVILPDRINQPFLNWFAAINIKKVMVIHANHANEIDQKTGLRLQSLANRNVTVLNQSVLLCGVNDDVDSLYQLSQRLFEFRVLPYYIHMLDKVQGAAHFEVDDTSAVALLDDLKQQLPGYLVPKLVREISGERSKQAIV